MITKEELAIEFIKHCIVQAEGLGDVPEPELRDMAKKVTKIMLTVADEVINEVYGEN